MRPQCSESAQAAQRESKKANFFQRGFCFMVRATCEHPALLQSIPPQRNAHAEKGKRRRKKRTPLGTRPAPPRWPGHLVVDVFLPELANRVNSSGDVVLIVGKKSSELFHVGVNHTSKHDCVEIEYKTTTPNPSTVFYFVLDGLKKFSSVKGASCLYVFALSFQSFGLSPCTQYL